MATVVKAKKDESKDSLFRRFRKRVIMDQVLPMYRKTITYIKPSQVRKEEKKARLQRIKQEKRLMKRYGA